MTAFSPLFSVAERGLPPGLRPRAASGAAMVVALHLALLWLATRPLPAPLSDDRRVWIQLLPPAPAAATLSVLPVKPAPPPAPRQPSQQSGTLPPPVSATVTATETGPASGPTAAPPAATAVQQAPYVDPLAVQPAPAALPADLREQALKAVGAIDRELRAGERKFVTAAPDTSQARLERGFAEARAAVKPKWFEAAQIELFSAPNDPKRIYRIITALGEYCLYYPDKASMSTNARADSGHASFGQPRMSSCPKRF